MSELVDAFDARGASNALWALATLHSVPGGVDADAGHAATKALIKALNGTLKDACNARDAANALWGCAKMRCGLSPETVKVLSSAVCIDTSDVGEASMALWAIASMRSDGTLAHGPARAAAVHVASSLSDKVGKWEKGKVDARVTANASWAATKLIEVGDASDSTASDALQAVLEGLLRRFISAASEAGPAFQLESPRAAAQLVAAHLALGGGASAVIPLINQGLKSCVTKGRKEMEKEAKQRAAQNGKEDATVRVQKPTDDDLAALCEAAERCGPSAEIEKNWLRSAVNAACTARVGDPAALGGRAAGGATGTTSPSSSGYSAPARRRRRAPTPVGSPSRTAPRRACSTRRRMDRVPEDRSTRRRVVTMVTRACSASTIRTGYFRLDSASAVGA